MKILKLVLNNFNAIKNAMDTTELSIDFSTTVNKICLMIGPNGSGKTTVLSMLHPFSDVGNLDVRNSNSLIIPNKDGYKEIHIKKNDDIYVIKHFYTAHKDKNHSVKSYIEKNGVELNINGNVSSFKEYVKEELYIETDYLKLIRLGANVTSLIDLSSTERKNFMSKIMDEIGIYLEYYKSVNLKLRQLDEMISHHIDQEKKLGILDKDEFEEEIEKLKLDIEKEEKIFIDMNNRATLLKNTIDKIDDVLNLKENLRIISKKYTKMRDILDRKDQIESLDINFYIKKISELEKIVNANINEYNSNVSLIQNSLDHLNYLHEQLRSYEIELSKSRNTDKEIDRMNDNIVTLRKRMRGYENILGDFIPPFSKVELERFIIFLKNSQQILGRTYEFGKLPVQKVIELMKNKKNVMNYINSHLIDIDDCSMNDSTSLFISTIASRFMLNENITIDCKEECIAKTLFYQIQNLLKNSNVQDKNEDVSFYKDMEFVYGNIINILPNFATYTDIINLLPAEIKKDFETDVMYDNISNLRPIFDDKSMNNLLSLVTEYENYINIKNECNDAEKTLLAFSGFTNSSNIENHIESIQNDIDNTKKKISNWKSRNLELAEENDECNKSIEIYSDIKETLEKYDEVKELYERYSRDYDLFVSTNDELTSVDINITRIKIKIDGMKEKLQNKQLDLFRFKTLQKELRQMHKIYDEMVLTKNALSSKQGIPLRFISNYLRNTEDITNELLDIAYNGKIYIDKFNITATEFSIPFFNKGIRLDDVKYASQGELSFLNVALSFALSSQRLKKYNIPLMDEADSALDSSNREKYIRIIENQLDRIDAEQSFNITHNDMFSAYPVDILDFSFKNDNVQYPLANFIKMERM